MIDTEKDYTRRVRGDSVRDFYAKTLAVVGLGLIAGAGAVVDYWPVARPLPEVDSRLALFSAPRSIPHNLQADIPLPPRVTSLASTPAPRTVVRPQHVAWPAFSGARDRAAAPRTAAVRLPMPKIPAMRMRLAPGPVEVPIEAAPAIELDPTTLGEPVALVAWAPPPPPADAHSTGRQAHDRNGQPGFFSGALKKTKDSIARTGAVAGASIADAFKGVFGAFKKVSPF